MLLVSLMSDEFSFNSKVILHVLSESRFIFALWIISPKLNYRSTGPDVGRLSWCFI